MFDVLASPLNFLWLVLLFGFAPGFVLRLIVKVYPRGHARRQELVSQLYTLGRVERVFFVAEQLETVLFEGIGARRRHLQPARPVVVAAKRWQGKEHSGDSQEWRWVQDREAGGWCIADDLLTGDTSVYNKAEDIWIKIDPGDWVVRGADGVFFALKDSEFRSNRWSGGA